MTKALRRGDLPPALTRRESEVCKLLSEGHRQTEIAVQLSVSQRTVEAHARSAREKLGYSNTFQMAVKLAVSKQKEDPPHGTD